MKFADSIWVDATPHRVWQYLGSLETWPRFCAKAGKGKCQQVSPQGDVVGARYDMEFGAREWTILCHYEIVDLEPGYMIAVRCAQDEAQELRSGWECRIVYEVQDEGNRTRVTERVTTADSSNFPINWLGYLLAWLVYRFRKLAGRTNLQRLKRLVEGTSE